jgi:hypothetical protein
MNLFFFLFLKKSIEHFCFTSLVSLDEEYKKFN